MKHVPKGFWIFSALLLLLLSVNVFAADKVLDASLLDREPVSLTEYLAVLEDPGSSLTLADVQKPDMTNRFKGGHAPAMALSYGFVRSAYWLRLTLRNTSNRPVERMLEIDYPLLSSIQFHQPLVDGTYRSIKTGNTKPFATRAHPNRNFVFAVTLPEHADQVIYLRIQSGSSMIIPATLWEPQAFYVHAQNDYALQTWYLGIASAMLLFNLLLLIALRDNIYLLYVGFVICTVFTVLSGNGLAKEYLWPDSAAWAEIAVSISYSLMITALLLFMRRMLNTQELIPRTDRLLKIIVCIELLVPIGYTASLNAVVKPFTLYQFAIGVLILFVSLFLWFVKRQRNAVYFTVAFSFFLGGSYIVALRIVNLAPTNLFTMNGLLFGSALEMLLLAFALADRFILIRRKAINDVEQANINLELRLYEREAELTATHERLREIEQRQMLSQERQRLMQDM
ncbi:MAG: hypothetical protein FD135_5192, partial [Comamonadaceae bacterium]